MLDSERKQKSITKDKTTCLYVIPHEPVEDETFDQKTSGDPDEIKIRRFRALLENIPCAIYSVFPAKTGPTTFMSGQWKKWTGYSPEELYQDPQAWPKCIHPDDREQAENAYDKACREGISYNLAYRVVHKDTGWVRYVRDQGVLGKDETGTVVRVDGIVTDITRQKNAENELIEYRERLEELIHERTAELSKAYQALKRKDEERNKAEQAVREAERQKSTILENVAELIIYRNAAMETVWMSRSTADWHGFTLDGIEGRVCHKARYGRNDPCEDCHVIKAMESGRRQEQDIRSPDGKYWHVIVNPILNDAGEVIGTVEVSQDVTKHKRAEEALRESEELHRAILSSISDALLITDSEGTFTYVCPDIHAIFGYSREEVLMMKGIEDLFGQILLDEKTFEKVGEIRNVELDVKDKTGVKRSLLVNIKKVAIESGTILYTCRDVTERKRAERELEAHLRFFESMDQINRAMQGTNDLEDTMCDVLDGALHIFNCDRAILMHPCDPEASSWRSMMARNRPEYAGDLEVGREIPMTPAIAAIHQNLLESVDPVKLGLGSGNPLPKEMSRLFDSQSQILMAIYPKTGAPWIFGLHQCSYLRIWTAEEERLLREIGRRLSDVLTSLLTYRDLQESERRQRLALQIGKIGAWEADLESGYGKWTPECADIWGFPSDFSGHLVDYCWQHVHPEDLERIRAEFAQIVQNRQVGQMEFRIIRPDRAVRWIQWMGQVVPDTKGGYSRLVGVDMDITERKQAERKLAEHQEQLKSLASRLSLSEEQDKHQLATKLHDQISQTLVVAKFKLDQLRKSMASSEWNQALEELCNCFVQLIDDAGTLTFEMSSPILHELGFEAAVSNWLVNEVQKKHFIETVFEDDGQDKPLDEDIQAILFRGVRELLLNVIKHSQARKVTVSIERIHDWIRVNVQDDGIGFDPDEVATMAAQRAEFGLFSIREGLEQLGGRIEIDSKPGCGSKIVMTALLKVAAEGAKNEC